jgi:2-polyprenyl-6-methoxyphenol hydroxylase-like FAD-dependent oxidoreductase
VRSEFDDIVFKHAAESGASVHDGVRVTEIKFSTDNSKKPIAAEWKSDQGSGEIKFSWLVDASGRNGIMSTRYLKNRKFNQALKNVAVWGYFEGGGMYGVGTRRENAPWFEALTGQRPTAFCCFYSHNFCQMRLGGLGISRFTRAESPSVWSFQKRPTAPRRNNNRTSKHTTSVNSSSLPDLLNS